MSNDATPRLNLPYLAASQAQKHVTLNEGLGLIDGLLSCAVVSRSVGAQPPDPDDGALYILPATPAGADWSLAGEGALMRFESGAWTELQRTQGQIAFVADETALLIFDDGAWMSLAAALGARARLNKTASGAVASLVFQTGFSGRGEIGLVGDDALRLRVSADGTAWSNVLTAAPGAPMTAGAGLDLSDADTGPSRLAVALAVNDRLYGGVADPAAPPSNWLELSEYGFWHLVYGGASVLQMNDYWVHSDRPVDTAEHFSVAGVQVVGARQPAIADAASGAATADLAAKLNTLLAAVRAHGLIAT